MQEPLFSQMPDDILFNIFDKMGLTFLALNNMRLVDTNFNQTVTKLVENYLREIEIEINARSTYILKNSGKIEFSNEKMILDIITSVEFLKKVGGTDIEKNREKHLLKMSRIATYSM